MKWRLKRTEQCAKCPWRTDVDPHDIPNGYSEDKHKALKGTISDGSPEEMLRHILNKKPMRIMACHEEHSAHCVGWLMNQIGQGNNIALRIYALHCENISEVKLRGEQHETFEETLPKL